MALKRGVFLPLAEDIQGLKDRQSGFDQGQKLLVKNDKLIGFQDLLARASTHGQQSTPALDRVDHEALLDKALPDLLLGDATFNLLEHVTALVRHFNQKFSHEMRIRGKLRLPYTSLTFYGFVNSIY